MAPHEIDEMMNDFVPAGRKWSKKDIWDVADMSKAGKSNKEIADHFSVTPQAIATLKVEKDLPRRKQKKWTSAELNEIRRMLKAGRTVMQIADELKIKYNRLERCISYYKLKDNF